MDGSLGRLVAATSLIALYVAPASGANIKAAVLRSMGTGYLSQTIWNDLNTGWSTFGDVPVTIDYTSLAGTGLTRAQMNATGADVLIVSCMGFASYTNAEIDAITQYVQDGHGIIITYYSFYAANSRLAPLVGMRSSNAFGTGTVPPLSVSPASGGDSLLFASVPYPYLSGVSNIAHIPPPGSWQLDGGVVAANLNIGDAFEQPAIVTRDAPTYRGLYFSYYVENKSDGSNKYDAQVFYNSLLWTTHAPEPSSAMLWLGALWVFNRRFRRR